MQVVQAEHDSEGPVGLVRPEKGLFYLAPSDCLFPVAAAPAAPGTPNPAMAKPWSFPGSSFLPQRWGFCGTLMQDPAVTLAKVTLLAPAWPTGLLVSRSGHFLSSQILVLPFSS